ncbi:MAG: Eco57I restriction-modification methylase domain-containing protein [Puniceicoccales bacterium]|nr:Eco57I restriction-modification methylase domain-containing protein [Puniceicoccales bacterium]
MLEVRVSGQVDLQRNRAGLHKLVARFIGQPQADAVLAFFVGDAPDYRFSFATRTNNFSADGQLEQYATAPRRYTYLFGPGQPCRTALERLELLRSLGARAQLADLIEAFKVEPLFKEFYRDYGRVFDAVETHIRPSLPDKEPLRLFTQRLFNRLMFLAFVERKGWLRFDRRTDYLAALWDDYTAKRRTGSAPGNFYADRLTPLFFAGLNQPDRPADSTDPRFGSVPYLNGGLFEYAEDGTDRLASLRVPDEALALILDSESGLFSRYNFTVAESTPLEINVAVDPEMLGKVFEELITGRHEQGSYYTPKPIVAFMGRAALVEHLADRCPAESRAALEKFVHEDDASALRDPEAIHRALVDVKICDPACGSGAYLLGLLHELLDLRTRIFATRQKPDPESSYTRRLQIIERNLYGVDKDAFAVNIARLRLWLALVVEYDGPAHKVPPLPNLDFKIEVGDALSAPAPAAVLNSENTALINPAVQEFRLKKDRHLRAHGPEKTALRQEIDRLKTDIKGWLATENSRLGQSPDDAFHWAIEFAEVFMPTPATETLSGGLNLGDELAVPAQPGGFDIIVANPPYVRQELIKDQKPILKRRFPEVFSGLADLYVYFYARAHELLRLGGIAAFISSNKWLRAGYGESLRQHLLDAQAFRFVMDFGELGIFDTAATDAAIFSWSKLPRGELATQWAMVKNLDECYKDSVHQHFGKLATGVPSSQFGSGKPRLATVATASLRKKMERSGPTLGEIYKGEILYGVKTGLNEAFVVNQETRKAILTKNPAADEIIRPIISGDDARRYEIHYRGQYVILTKIGTPMNRYPAVMEHLLHFERQARKRADQGSHWWELRACDYYDKLCGTKIIIPAFAKEARFPMDTKGICLNAPAYFISTEDSYLLGVINSAAAFRHLLEICSVLGDKEERGRAILRPIYFEKLPIPDASTADREIVGQLAKQAQALHGQRRARSEQFIRALSLDPADSTSRNPLEQPWSLAPEDYAKRARKLHGRAPDLKLYEAARDETAALTGQIAKVEAEIDARVAALYGLDAEDQRWAAQSAPVDAKQIVFFDLLGRLKSRRAHFSHTEVQAAVNDPERLSQRGDPTGPHPRRRSWLVWAPLRASQARPQAHPETHSRNEKGAPLA